MNVTDVTVGGQQHLRPGRDAVTGARWALPGDREPARRPSPPPPGEGAVDGYYGQPVVNLPVWKAREIAGYFFLGGLAGAGSVVAAAADLTGRRHLALGMKVTAVGAAGLGVTALVKDLGVPSRFYNMLRVLRPTSPMSVGSWLLGAYVPAAVVAAGTHATGRMRPLGVLATAGAAALGPAVASYTGALVSDTAVPAWHDGHRHMPLLFAASAASAAAGAGLVVAPRHESAPVRRLAMAATAAELALESTMTRRMDEVGEAYHRGKAGQLSRLSKGLAIAGVAAAAVGRRSRIVSGLGGAALLASSAVTRFAVFEAGMQSAADPRATIGPQRRRIEQGDVAGGR